MNLSRLTSRLKQIFPNIHLRRAGTLLTGIGCASVIMYTFQDIRYERERLKSLSPEGAKMILEKYNLKPQKDHLEHNLEWLETRREDNDYEMVPLQKPYENPKLIKDSETDTVKDNTPEGSLRLAYTKFCSLRAEGMQYDSLMKRRLAGEPNQAVKYKTLQEFEPLYTDLYIAAKILSREVDKILDIISEGEFRDLAKETKEDIETLIESLQESLNFIEKSLERLGKGPVRKNR